MDVASYDKSVIFWYDGFASPEAIKLKNGQHYPLLKRDQKYNVINWLWSHLSITIPISTGSWVGALPFIAETCSWVGAPSLKAGMVGFRVAAPSVKARTGSRVGAPGFSGPRPSHRTDSGWPGSLSGGPWVPAPLVDA